MSGNLNIVLIPGFACSAAFMQPLADRLMSYGRVSIVELPAMGDAPALMDVSLDKVLHHLVSQINERSLVIGWSLGGMLAAQLAHRHPDKVCALVTLGANARFVSKDDYLAAMPAKINDQFNQQFMAEPAATLKRFYGLMAQGDSSVRSWIKLLRDKAPKIHAHWCDYLALLAQLDNRPILKSLTLPCLHLLAEKDALVPRTAAIALRRINPVHGVCLLLNLAHSFVFSHPQVIVERLLEAELLSSAVDACQPMAETSL